MPAPELVSDKPSTSSRNDTRQNLLVAGVELFLESGYHNTGLEAILKRVGVPKGSFYYYFNSKEQFGIEVLRYYSCQKFQKMDRFFGDLALSPLNRIRCHMLAGLDEFQAAGYTKGCLFGNLAQEMAGTPIFRKELDTIVGCWKQKHRDCFAQAQAIGELPPSMDLDVLVDAFFMMIEGAILNAKVTRTDYSLRVMHWLFFQQLGHPAAELPDGQEARLSIAGPIATQTIRPLVGELVS